LLVGVRSSIVSDVYGTTRDRVNLNTSWGNRIFTLVDTGGLDVDIDNNLWVKVKKQIYSAIDEADVLVMVVDASIGITSSDRYVADVIRKVFNKSHDEATRIMLQIHTEGIGICGMYPFEIAETKMNQVLNLAKESQHPLQCIIEKI
jgi:ATP-dependent Clp protease adapter protein ClpS